MILNHLIVGLKYVIKVSFIQKENNNKLSIDPTIIRLSFQGTSVAAHSLKLSSERHSIDKAVAQCYHQTSTLFLAVNENLSISYKTTFGVRRLDELT